ncbi:MAG: hypothetical protein WC628_09375 [Candidatus Omnitrophota bacterium]
MLKKVKICLSNQEKKEMLSDGKSRRRKKSFARAKLLCPDKGISLDKFLRYLKGLQVLTSPFSLSRRVSLSRMNKL